MIAIGAKGLTGTEDAPGAAPACLDTPAAPDSPDSAATGAGLPPAGAELAALPTGVARPVSAGPRAGAVLSARPCVSRATALAPTLSNNDPNGALGSTPFLTALGSSVLGSSVLG